MPRKYIWRFIIAVLLFIGGGIILADIIFPPRTPSLTGTAIPQDTAVVIQTATEKSYDWVRPSPRSEIYFYDAAGAMLACAYEPEVSYGDFIVERTDGVCFFFKDRSVLADARAAVTMPNESDIISGGARAAGYIAEFDLCYALMNTGPDDAILRFVSQDVNYDVTVPYYLDGAYYDAQNQRFICIINRDLNDIEPRGDHNYVTVYYDAAVQRFVLDEDIHDLNDPDLSYEDESITDVGYMAKGGLLYNVAVVCDDKEDIYGTGSMLLNTFDLTTDSYVSGQTLLADYELGVYGGVMPGPTGEDKDGRLYVFAATEQAFIISDEQDVQILDIPEEFIPWDGAPLFRIEDDGSIYMLCRPVDGYLRIYRLKENAGYDLFWEGAAPMIPQDMRISDFEIMKLS